MALAFHCRILAYQVHLGFLELVMSCLFSVFSSCDTCVTTIPGIWIFPGAVFPISRDIHIPGLFDDFRITNSGILENHGIYIMLIFRMNSLMLHRI